MKILQFNPYQYKVGWGESKKSKLIPLLPRGAGLKSPPIPVPPPLRGERSREGWVKRVEVKLPPLIRMSEKTYKNMYNII